MVRSSNSNRGRAIKKGIVFLTLLWINIGVLVAGGPWTQQKDKGYFKLSEWWLIFDGHYTDAGAIDPNITTGIFNTFLYAEYGFSDRFTGLLNASIFSRNYMNNLVSKTTGDVLIPGEAVNALGDIDVGGKYSLTQPGSRFPIAASIVLGIPTGMPSAGSQGNLQTGDGEFNQMIQLDAGTGFALGEKIGGYVSAYAGVNNRTKNFSEEFRYGFEAGIGLFQHRLWLTGRLFGIESFKNGATAASVTSTSIFANNTEYTSIAGEVSCYVTKRVGVSGGYATAFRGEIIAAAPSYTAGIFYDLSR